MRADRLISIMMLLQTRGQMTAQELADRCEVSTRTIYRDLDALSGAGVPVYAERGPYGGCALMESYRTNLTGLKEDEVRALFMFTVPGLLEDLGVDKTSEEALLKLSAALPAPFQRSAETVRRRLHLDSAGWFQFEEPTPHLATVQEALWEERRLNITYRSAGGARSKHLVDPYGLVAKAGIWYLVGKMMYQIQVYRVSRIQAATVTDKTITYPEEFDLPTYWTEWSSRFEADIQRYAVTLRVAPEGIPTLVKVFGEGIHHLLSQPANNENYVWDRQWSEFTLKFESAEAACRQILSLGTIIEIVEPQELRIQVADMAQQLLRHHRCE